MLAVASSARLAGKRARVLTNRLFIKREKASVNFHALVRDVEAYLIVGYISAAELAVWGMDIKGDEPISAVPTHFKTPQSRHPPFRHPPLDILPRHPPDIPQTSSPGHIPPDGLTSRTLIPIIHPIPNPHPANHHRTADTERSDERRDRRVARVGHDTACDGET